MILVPRSGVKPIPPALEGEGPWTSREASADECCPAMANAALPVAVISGLSGS